MTLREGRSVPRPCSGQEGGAWPVSAPGEITDKARLRGNRENNWSRVLHSALKTKVGDSSWMQVHVLVLKESAQSGDMPIHPILQLLPGHRSLPVGSFPPWSSAVAAWLGTTSCLSHSPAPSDLRCSKVRLSTQPC